MLTKFKAGTEKEIHSLESYGENKVRTRNVLSLFFILLDSFQKKIPIMLVALSRVDWSENRKCS